VGHFQRVSSVSPEGEEMVADAAGVYPFIIGPFPFVQRKLAPCSVFVSSFLGL
jgi:hypothetical protein